MSKIPEQLKYTKEHEWILLEKDQGTVGITDFAQKALGDIVYIELPEVGARIEKDKAFGVVESIKSVSDLFAPVSGEVVEVNQEVLETPELCNQDPYSSWFIKIKISDTQQTLSLLSNTQYQEHCDNIS